MMDRLPALPLIVNGPYFSIWMPGDTLTDTNTTHWAGAVKPLRGGITVDGKRFHWLGAASNPAAETLSIQVTPTQTSSTLLAAGVQLDVRFWAPALPDDLEMLSAPVTYVDLSLCSTDGKPHQVSLDFLASDRLCYEGEVPPAMSGSSYDCNGLHIAYTGQEQQKILGHSGDHITIDWGYLYMASRQGCVERRGNHLSFTLADSMGITPHIMGGKVKFPHRQLGKVNHRPAQCVYQLGTILQKQRNGRIAYIHRADAAVGVVFLGQKSQLSVWCGDKLVSAEGVAPGGAGNQPVILAADGRGFVHYLCVQLAAGFLQLIMAGIQLHQSVDDALAIPHIPAAAHSTKVVDRSYVVIA